MQDKMMNTLLGADPDRTERRLVAEPRGTAGVAAGASPSNTAPSNRIESENESRIVHTGIDSLYLSYAGELKPDVEQDLESLKSLAQSEDPQEQAGAVLSLCDHRFEVKDKGKGRYPFVLQDGVFHLQLSRAQAKSLPMVYAQIGSEALTRTGVRYTEIALNNLVSVLGTTRAPATISRVDLCVDFVTDVELEGIPRNAWINRANKRSSHEDRGRFSGLTFGMGGALSARLYDKTREIEHSEKTYLYDVWNEGGWAGEYPVWRLEFEFHRTVLREFWITTVEELLALRAALWCYAMHWLRLVVPSLTDNTKERWPNHPLWDVLLQAEWGMERGEPLTRTRKTRPPSDKFLFVNGLGALTSYMAREGITDFVEGLRRFGSDAHEYHLLLSQLTGKTLSTYAREKAQGKARRFNTYLATESSPASGNASGEDEE
jgi:hypothetical protein